MGVTKLEKLNLEFCMRALTLTQIMPPKYPNMKKCAIGVKPGALPFIVKFKKIIFSFIPRTQVPNCTEYYGTVMNSQLLI